MLPLLLLRSQAPSLLDSEAPYISVIYSVAMTTTETTIQMPGTAGFCVIPINAEIVVNLGASCHRDFLDIECDRWYTDKYSTGGVYVASTGHESAFMEIYARGKTQGMMIAGGLLNSSNCDSVDVLSRGTVENIDGTQACFVTATNNGIIHVRGTLAEGQTIYRVNPNSFAEVQIDDAVSHVASIALGSQPLNGSVEFTDITAFTASDVHLTRELATGIQCEFAKIVGETVHCLSLGYTSPDNGRLRWLILIAISVIVSVVLCGAIGLIVGGCCFSNCQPRNAVSSSQSSSERQPTVQNPDEYAPRQPGLCLEDLGEEADFYANQGVDPHAQFQPAQYDNVEDDPDKLPVNPYETRFEQGY